MMYDFFRDIRKKLSSEQKAFLAISASFVGIGIIRLIMGGVPWYFAIFGLPMFVAAFLYPRAGLFSVVVLTVLFERFFALEGFQIGRDSIKLYPIDIVLLGIYTNVAVYLASGKMKRVFRWSDAFLVGFFVLSTAYFVLAFAGFGSGDISVAFSTWKNYVFYGALVFVLPLIMEREGDLLNLSRYFLAAAALGIAFLCIGIIRGDGLWTEYTPLSTEGVRLLAFPHAFYFSLAFLGMMTAAGQWFSDKRRFVILGLLGAWGLGILGSLMRHIWIALIFALTFAFLFMMDRMARQRAFRAGIMAVSFLSVFLSLGIFFSVLFPYTDAGRSFHASVGAVLERTVSIGNGADESISWRGVTWKSAFAELEKNPLFGSGFGVRVAVESDADYRDFVEIRNIHNSWFALLVQSGVFGATLFLSGIAAIVIAVFQMRSRKETYIIGRAILLTYALYISIVMLAQPYLETNFMGIFFWLTLGLLRTLPILEAKQDSRAEAGMVSEKAFDI